MLSRRAQVTNRGHLTNKRPTCHGWVTAACSHCSQSLYRYKKNEPFPVQEILCFFPSHDGDQQAQEDDGDVII